MIKVSKAIAANTDLLTAQAFVYPRRSKNGEQMEYLFLVVSAGGEDIFIQVRQKGLQLEEWFFSSEEAVSEKFTQGYQTLTTHLSQAENLEFALGFLQSDGRLYLQFFGQPKVELLRQDQLIDLLEGFSPGQLIFGRLEVGDKVVVASSAVDSPQKSLENRFLKQLLNVDKDNLEDEIEMYYQKNNLLDPLAVVTIDNDIDDFQNLNSPISQPAKMMLPKINLRLPNLRTLPKKTKLVLALLPLLLFVLGWFLYSQHQNQVLTDQKFNSFYQQASSSYEQAKSLKDSQPEDSTKALSLTRDNLAGALKIKPGNKQALALKEEIDQNAESIEHIYHISDWPLFLSLDLIKDKFNAKNMVYSLGQLLFYDQSQKSLILLDLDKKTNRILAGPNQLGEVKSIALNSDQAFSYSDDKGVVKVDTTSPKPEVIIKPDPQWGLVKSIYAFAGNIYLLDIFKNQIWKYVPIKNGYSEKFNYLNEGQKADFSGAKMMFIDSSIWVLKQGPEILKYTAGNEDNFSPSGLDKPLQEISSMFVSETDDRVYLLDSENSRLVVLKKNGQYVAQYIGDKFKTATDLAVSDKKIYLLESNKLYQLDLR